MELASEYVVPPEEWHHDPELKNDYGTTVADLLDLKLGTIPEEWWYDESENKS